MEMKLVASSNAVGESNFHIQLTPAFRQDIFRDEQIAELTLAFILEKLQELKVRTLKNLGFSRTTFFSSSIKIWTK